MTTKKIRPTTPEEIYSWVQKRIDGCPEEGIQKYKYDHMSPTKLSMYIHCGRQYLFRYVLKSSPVRPPAGIMLVGDACHQTFENYWNHKKKTGEDLPFSTMTEFLDKCLKDKFHAEWQQDEPEDLLQATAMKVVNLFRIRRGIMTTPIDIEKEVLFNLEWNGKVIPMKIRIDLITEEEIIDHKITGSRIKKEVSLTNDIQLATYAIAENIPDKFIGWDFYYRKSAMITFESVKAHCSTLNVDRIKDMYYNAVVGIEKGIFLPAAPDSDNWRCSERFCAFWKQCMGFHTIGGKQ